MKNTERLSFRNVSFILFCRAGPPTLEHFLSRLFWNTSLLDGRQSMVVFFPNGGMSIDWDFLGDVPAIEA